MSMRFAYGAPPPPESARNDLLEDPYERAPAQGQTRPMRAGYTTDGGAIEALQHIARQVHVPGQTRVHDLGAGWRLIVHADGQWYTTIV